VRNMLQESAHIVVEVEAFAVIGNTGHGEIKPDELVRAPVFLVGQKHSYTVAHGQAVGAVGHHFVEIAGQLAFCQRKSTSASRGTDFMKGASALGWKEVMTKCSFVMGFTCSVCTTL